MRTVAYQPKTMEGNENPCRTNATNPYNGEDDTSTFDFTYSNLSVVHQPVSRALLPLLPKLF